MKKRIIIILLSAAAVFIWIPFWMLLSASFMRNKEIAHNLAPILMGNTEISHNLTSILTEQTGYAHWPLLPQYPTLKSYIELLLDTPEFFTMFWNSCQLVFPIVIGQILIGAPAAWAFARFQFYGKKYFMHSILY